MNWQNIIAVFIGSGLGGVCRFLTTKAIGHLTSVQSVFPWGTFAVNVTGCFLIGLIYGISDRYWTSGEVAGHLRLLLATGFCGGFTTFSTFADENYRMIQSSDIPMALGYAACSVCAGFALVFVGYKCSQI